MRVRAPGAVDARVAPPVDAGIAPRRDARAPVTGEDAGEPTGVTLRFDRPRAGERFTRDLVHGHEWAARVPLRVSAEGVVRVEFWVDDAMRVDAADGEPWEGAAVLVGEGEWSVVARGLDRDGRVVAREEVRFHVDPPVDPSCHAMLDALRLGWEPAGATRGVDEPIFLDPVVHGVAFRFVSSSAPSRMLMDCGLAVRLSELAYVVRDYDIEEVVHIGVYNYRCIGGGDPSSGTCTPSQHAYARAIDLHEFRASDGTRYNVETDWMITSGDTCSQTPSSPRDQVLHDIACRLWSDRIFQVVLTPNYNGAHRNHFHVDMTAGSMFIGDGVQGVDPLVPGLGH